MLDRGWARRSWFKRSSILGILEPCRLACNRGNLACQRDVVQLTNRRNIRGTSMCDKLKTSVSSIVAQRHETQRCYHEAWSRTVKESAGVLDPHRILEYPAFRIMSLSLIFSLASTATDGNLCSHLLEYAVL